MLARISLMMTLVFAGEVVFGLPFHTARFYRPTLLEAFSFSNTQLGDIFAVYGVMAMLAYFPGGALADRFPARNLLAMSLVATGLGGFYMATYPGSTGMKFLYGYWGVTTILLFWAAMIRATREWGGDDSQGKAFGILDGGRGLVAAVMATLGVAIFAYAMPDNVEAVTAEARKEAFRQVILMYSAGAFVAAVFVWLLVPARKHSGDTGRHLLHGAVSVLSRPIVWTQAGVIVTAYCCFKGLDNYSLYAAQVLGFDEVQSARLTSWGAYIRTFSAVIAGVLADRFSAGRALSASFLLLVLSYAALAFLSPQRTSLYLLLANLAVSAAAVFALRGIYFALLEESRVPPYLTGAVAGTVSFIGFTPDIFFGPITGRILDANPGVVGHQNYFLFLAGIAMVGVLVVLLLLRQQKRINDSTWPTPSESLSPNQSRSKT